jgi:hypothetical protein
MLKLPQLLFAATLLLLVACSDGTTPGNDSIPPVDTTTPSDTVPEPPQTVYRDTFYLDQFIKLVDSMFTGMSGDEVVVTVVERNPDRKNGTIGAEIFPPATQATSKQYLFDAGPTNNSLDFNVRQCVYKDSAALDAAFAVLHSHKMLEEGPGGTPGLSYGNDAVIRCGNQLLWVNTGCTFSYADHQKIKALMLRCIPGAVVKDEIDCKCGDAVCK